jgi:peptidoglycan/xylan/chitin deacetylase (PgdA/CDA1 family)
MHLVLYIVLIFALLVGFLFLTWIVLFSRGKSLHSPILAYHNITDVFNITITHSTRRDFREGLSFLRDHGYRAKSLDHLLSSKQANHKEFGIIFDDSYQDLVNEPLDFLHAIGFTATLFIIVNYIGRANKWDVAIKNHYHMSRPQIENAVEKGFSIGSHTLTHRDLTLLCSAEMKKELLESKQRLEEMFNTSVKFVSYPFGRFNRRVMDMAKECGYEAGFTINNPVFYDGNRMCIPTYGIYSIDAKRNLLSKVSRDRYFWLDQMKTKLINRFARGTIMVKGTKQYG